MAGDGLSLVVFGLKGWKLPQVLLWGQLLTKMESTSLSGMWSISDIVISIGGWWMRPSKFHPDIGYVYQRELFCFQTTSLSKLYCRGLWTSTAVSVHREYLWEGLQMGQIVLSVVVLWLENTRLLSPLYFWLSLCVIIVLVGIERPGGNFPDYSWLFGYGKEDCLMHLTCRSSWTRQTCN